MPHYWRCLFCFFLFDWATVGDVRTVCAQTDLATKAQAIFKQHCYRCHGEAGKAEAELYVLNHDSLVPKHIAPGNPEKSSLLAKIRSGDMPQDADPLTKEEQDTIQKWIAEGAADFSPAKRDRKFISPADTLIAIAADLAAIEKTNRDDLPFIRYFTITHLYNANRDLDDDQLADQLATYRNALSKLINSLSWGRRVKPPRAIDPQQTLFAIDLRDYKWNEKIWETIVAANPYGVKHDSTSAKYAYKVSGSELPVVRGDWFVAAASRPPLYHQVLQLPESDRELENKLQVDVEENLRTRKVWRAGFNGSGVSQNNRLIERHESDLTNGAYWKSYDFAGNDGVKNLFAHPLGPKGTNAFEADGGEIIFNLPNGLQAYLLVDAKGKRIDKGPTNVVSDPVQRDRAVVNGVSCMSCHFGGMLPKKDEVRDHVEQNRASFSTQEIETVLAIYPPAAKFDEFLTEDANRFTEAVQKTGAPVSKHDPIVQLSMRFEAELNVKLAAAEVGLPVEDFLKGLDRSPALSRALGSLKVPGRKIKREVFVAAFGNVVKELDLGTFVSRVSQTPKDYTSPSTGMKFVLIPSGEFRMGSSKDDIRGALLADANLKEEYLKDEQPQHSVRITQPFYMGLYEVTQGEFQKVLGRNTSYFSGTRSGNKGFLSINDVLGIEAVSGMDTSRFPAENLTWFDAIEFCNNLSEADGRLSYYRLTGIERNGNQSVKTATVTVSGGNGYRLPTEAEWEYACRANTTTPFHFGGILNGDRANVDGTSPFGTTTKGAYLERTTNVGSYAPNAFGLFDMHGNVWEWCFDVFDESAFKNRGGTTIDPVVATGSESRVLRGGSWFGDSRLSRSAGRFGLPPANGNNGFGLRVVCIPR